MLSVKVFKRPGSNSFNSGQHVPVMNIISSYIYEPIDQLYQLFDGWEEVEDEPPAQNSYFSLDLQAGEMNAVMVALGWLNDRDLCRICADLPAQDGKDVFEMTLEHLRKWRRGPGVSAKRKFGLLTDPEKRMEVAIKKAFEFHKRWPRDESKRIIRVLSLMLLHRRGNRLPGHQFPKFSLELFDIYIDMFDYLLETDSNFDEIRSRMFSPPPVPGYIIQKLPQRAIDDKMANCVEICAICTFPFQEGTQATELPCKHLYHGACIAPWLWHHNSCPMCRRLVSEWREEYVA